MRLPRTFAVVCIVLGLTTAAESDPDSSDAALAPLGHTFFCMKYPADCQATAAKSSLPSVAKDRARQLDDVNRAVNASITPKVDPDQIDRNWIISPVEGDCDDYAVTKRHQLLQDGWSSSSLLLAEVTLRETGEHHLILIARGTNGNWVLDNRSPEVLRFAETRNEYVWNRVESAADPRFWTTSFSDLSAR